MIIRMNDFSQISTEEKDKQNFYYFTCKSHGRLIYIIGRPKVGKTALALDTAIQYARKNKKLVCIFSLEMSAHQCYKRFCRMLSGIDDTDLNNLPWGERKKYCDAEKELGKLNISINDMSHVGLLEEWTVDAIEKNVNQNENVGLVVIDYFQLLSEPRNNFNTRIEECMTISKKMRDLAKRKNIIIIVTAQEGRRWPSHQPIDLKELKEVGCDEKDADIVIDILRDTGDSWQNIHCPNELEAEICILKSCDEALGRKTYEWQKDFMNFKEVYNDKNRTLEQGIQ